VERKSRWDRAGFAAYFSVGGEACGTFCSGDVEKYCASGKRTIERDRNRADGRVEGAIDLTIELGETHECFLSKMRDNDDTEWIPGVGDHRGNLLFSAGASGATGRTQTNNVPALRICVAGLTFARAYEFS